MKKNIPIDYLSKPWIVFFFFVFFSYVFICNIIIKLDLGKQMVSQSLQ